MSITIPKPKVPLKGKLYDEVDGVRYPLRVPTPEITGHPIAGEWVDGVWYAIEEDEYVSEGEWHSLLVVDLFYKLCNLLRHRPSAHVFCDRMTYWQESDNKKKLAPDLLVLPVLEEPLKRREALYLYREASWPIFVLEVLSDSTSDRDYEEKFRVYQDQMQVPEYFICHPDLGEQQVWGYRLESGEYREIEPGEQGRVWSEQLMGWFGADEMGTLQVWDADGRRIPGYGEAVGGQEAAERERDAAQQERDAAQQERDAALRRAEAAEVLLRGQGLLPGDDAPAA